MPGLSAAGGVEFDDPTVMETTDTVTLAGGFVGNVWSGAVLVDSALIEGGGTAWLRLVQRVGSSVQLRLSATETGDPLDAGPEFTDGVTLYDTAFTFAEAGGDSVTLKGPNHADNTFQDPSEPYFWTPDNGSDWAAWVTGTGSGAITVTIRGEVPVVPDALEIGGTAMLPGLTASGGVSLVDPDPLEIGGSATMPGLSAEGGVSLSDTAPLTVGGAATMPGLTASGGVELTDAAGLSVGGTATMPGLTAEGGVSLSEVAALTRRWHSDVARLDRGGRRQPCRCATGAV